MITEDAAGFLNDFGQTVVFGAVSTKGILDVPSEIIAGGMVISTDYSLTYSTASMPNLQHGSAITVGGAAYTVRDVRAQDDGTFSIAYLSKT